ncbi:kelch domain-containing protein 7A [Aplochiton taeniatus]
MPIAELLGVQLDMHLLGRLSLSVAAVVLVSWAYRYYSSRSTRKRNLSAQASPERDSPSPPGTCRKCKMALRPKNAPELDTGEDKQPGAASSGSLRGLLPDAVECPGETAPTLSGDTERIQSTAPTGKSLTDEDGRSDAEMPLYAEDANVTAATRGATLNLPSSTESGLASPTGRRSPCFLQRLEGSVGIGRELRQQLEHQGAYSSFLSKAEVTVGDANLVLEGPGEQVVRGKIYEYYVESSSHSVVDSRPPLGPRKRPDSESPGEFGSRAGSLSESPSSLSPIVMRDLVLTPNRTEEPLESVSPGTRHAVRPPLLRKESYLAAAENSELPHDGLATRGSVGEGDTLASPLSPLSSLTLREEPAIRTVAGAPYLKQPSPGCWELESFRGRLDLGNCIEVLGLAKKHGQAPLQQAALKVMSDNYLQVLREPSLYGRLLAGEREQVQRQRMKGRRFLVAADMDPQDWAGGTVLGAGLKQCGTSSGLYYYDDYQDTWHSLCPVPPEVAAKGCAMCTLDNYLFVAVGCQGTERDMRPSKRVFCYNPVTSIWTEISPMNEARPHCKMAALDGFIYAIGGECLFTVERYDPRTDRWTFVAPLPNETFAVAHRVTACNGELFVSGGTLRYTLLRYDPRTNLWRRSTIMGSRERTTDIVAVGNFLYRFDVNPVLGLSVHRYHTVAKLWYEVSTKRLIRCPAFQCVAVDDSIYCLSRQFTMRFQADEVSPGFMDEELSVLSAAKGMLFPFTLSLPDKKALQTSV